MGVFSSVANAEELRARLELAGVPARIEARVQVGPFATRQEAEQAREKLRSLGMDPGLVMAARK
jgi:DedD protein